MIKQYEYEYLFVESQVYMHPTTAAIPNACFLQFISQQLILQYFSVPSLFQLFFCPSHLHFTISNNFPELFSSTVLLQIVTFLYAISYTFIFNHLQFRHFLSIFCISIHFNNKLLPLFTGNILIPLFTPLVNPIHFQISHVSYAIAVHFFSAVV